VLPFPFADGVADCFESEFKLLFRDGTRESSFTGTGAGAHGTPPRLRITYDGSLGPNLVVSVKVTKIVSRLETGRPQVPVDRLTDVPPQK
jgi:hypothetical protein